MKDPGQSPPARDSGAVTDDEAQLPALAWMHRAHAADELLCEVKLQVSRRRRRQWLATTAVAAVVLTGVSLWLLPPAGKLPVAPPVATATTIRPEQQRLPDGSVVELKGDAEIIVDFDGPLRRVVLRRGEAYFAVAKNPHRAFVVEAGGVSVRAVGTAFTVQFDRRQVEVLVTEGQVAVSPPSGPPAVGTRDVSPVAPTLIGAGNRCVVEADTKPKIQPVLPAELNERLGWRVAQLEFSGTPLAEVVALMNEHNPRGVRFVIGHPALNRIRLSGFLLASNDAGLVGLLEAQFGVQAERSGDTITLRSSVTGR